MRLFQMWFPVMILTGALSVPAAALGTYRTISDTQHSMAQCDTGMIPFAAGYRLAHAGCPGVRVVYGSYTVWRALPGDLLRHLPGEKNG